MLLLFVPYAVMASLGFLLLAMSLWLIKQLSIYDSSKWSYTISAFAFLLGLFLIHSAFADFLFTMLASGRR